ncbi:4Fe-4S dicluster domain-containing protein [Acinetobacter sichuanensis]|uniref:4Fe-4S dicluster domain-containing protein n=1 Tax=Acinetobacter sichuanensis TaxID=2136183 RepID=A0A371YK00_9GAMM|nr:hypothetical protein C9E89_019910 [Acinetobacter sichuanensis]
MLLCKICDIKDFSQNIIWITPKGGGDQTIQICNQYPNI